MVNRWLAAENFRRVSAILLACCLLFNFHSVSATRFSDPVNPISPEVPLRLKTLEQCVENGTSVAIVPESEQTCPCTLFVGDGSSAPIEGDYLVVRKDEYEAWENSGSGTTLFADVKVEIISPDPTKLRRRIEIPNEGKHVLVVRTKAKSSQCVELNYMFAAKERKFCPTRMNAETSLGSEKGIRHSIIAGTSQVDDIIQNFMVGVYTDGRGACTGSVVGKNWVLTAAHCAPEANSTRIFVGGDYFSSGNEHVVNEVFLHPEFSSGAGPDGQISSAVVNDIALLRTEHSIDVVPIGINNNVKIPQDRDIVRAVGYGLTFSSAQRGSLNSVDVSEVPMPECQEDYKEVSGGVDLNGLNEHEHICAGPDEVCDGGVCRGIYFFLSCYPVHSNENFFSKKSR